jgi:hypothetical protein
MRSFFVSLALATFASLAMPREARATEKEWHLGASFGYSSLGFSRGRDENGAGAFLHARYGFTDAFDFTMNASFFGYVDLNQTRFAPATSAGINYVIDISRWLPSVGFTTGVVDVITTRCEDGLTLCGHSVQPYVGIPGSLEYRIDDRYPVGVRFEYQFLLLGQILSPADPSSALFFTAYAAFIP